MIGRVKIALVVFGTRPEAIKLWPVIRALRASGEYRVVSCSTGQHRDLVEPVSALFSETSDYDLKIMRPGQSLTYVAAAVAEGVAGVIKNESPDICLVQGDTTTAFAAALSAFYCRVPVAHVEAGLRTGDMASPWPEEGNRVMISRLADYHFAPTAAAERNLLAEGADPERVFLTGNTVVDAALHVQALIASGHRNPERRFSGVDAEAPVILFTMHRRESFGGPMERVFRALQQFCVTHNVQVLFPMHPNPSVRRAAQDILGSQPNVHLCDPLDYDELIYMLGRCRFVITDSGGLVEEAPSFGKPVLVLRDTTERPESVEAGCAILCGADPARMTSLADELLKDGRLFRSMASTPNPYGDGRAAERIAACLTNAGNNRPSRPSNIEHLGRAM